MIKRWMSMKTRMMKTILTMSHTFRDLDHLELDDLTIPDVIKLPNNNNNNNNNNNKNLNNGNANSNNGHVNSDQNSTNSNKSSIISNVKVDFIIFIQKQHLVKPIFFVKIYSHIL